MLYMGRDRFEWVKFDDDEVDDGQCVVYLDSIVYVVSVRVGRKLVDIYGMQPYYTGWV